GDWMRRQGNGEGLRGIKVGVIDRANKKALKLDDNKEYTLISDPSIIESWKHEAKMTYLGVKGYRPIITTFKELPLIVYHQFRDGNAVGDVMEAIKGPYRLLPEGKKIKHAYLDSEYYRADVIEYLRSVGTTFSITVDKDIAVKEAIKGIKEWKPFRDCKGVLTDREIGQGIHTMNKLSFSFRLIVLRWREKQGNLFSDGYHYHCIATDLESVSEEVVWRHNERANIENVIKELKNGFGMEYMPTGDFGANSFWFSLGVLGYNTFVMKKHFTLPEALKTKTIQSMRWLFYEAAGKVIKHARGFCLKIYADREKFILYKRVRLRCAELAV
ncbi:MAG: transposase, partial [Thermodesulfovibrionales bacterium]|nr:transposase [Thermodesulfovibrionales bacterium]